MDAGTIPEALSERLGIEATAALGDLFKLEVRDMTEAVLMRTTDRFERRLVEEVSKLRVEMLQGNAALRADLRDQKFELLKWSFLFWVGQVVTVAALLHLTGR